MAQTNSGGQGTNGVADESPNMIVYRKVRLLLFLDALVFFMCLCVCLCVCWVRACDSLASIYLTMSCAMEMTKTNDKTESLWHGWFKVGMLHQLDEHTENTQYFFLQQM